MAGRENQPKSVFLLLITGEIEFAELPTIDNLYCKYFYVYGSDWRQIRPQIVVCCYGHDSFGNDVIRGYGAAYLPTVSGRAKRSMAIFVPEASTAMHKILGFFTGRRAEFVDPRIVSMSEGRDVTRVRTQGHVTISFNTVLKDLKKFGYDTKPHSIAKPSEFPLSNFQDSVERTSPPPSIQPTTSTQAIVERTIPVVETTTDVEPQENPVQRIQVETNQSDDQIIEEIQEDLRDDI
uniref:B9 domain-containing protein 1 n=1 Tax=Acrobeloides nanus TaxID=290746 RepID=A0A914DJK4_9BILA